MVLQERISRSVLTRKPTLLLATKPKYMSCKNCIYLSFCRKPFGNCAAPLNSWKLGNFLFQTWFKITDLTLLKCLLLQIASVICLNNLGLSNVPWSIVLNSYPIISFQRQRNHQNGRDTSSAHLCHNLA